MFDAPRSILITGASSGIGAALAEAYAMPEITLVLLGRDAARLEAVAGRCRKAGAQVVTWQGDVRDEAAMHEAVVTLDEAHQFDLVIANAGISTGTFAGEKNLAAARAVFDVNLMGVLNTIHPVLPRMVQRGAGQIAIISSLASIIPLPSAAAYSASKAAVRYYGEALNGYLRGTGVQVSVVCPGWIRTPLTARNKFPMPFLMDDAPAAERIKQGLLRRKTRIAFPLRLYFALRLLEVLPVFVVEFLTSRMPGK